MDYFNKRDISNITKLNELLYNSLPQFCEEYFVGIESRTTTLTRLNYANDIKLFLYFLSVKVRRFRGNKTYQFTLSDIENLSPFEIEKYLSWLSNYTTEEGINVANREASKKRKLSSIRALIKYFCKKKSMINDPTISVDSPKLRSKEIIRLDNNEVGKLLNTVIDSKVPSTHQQKYLENTKVRDFAIMSLFLNTGIRVSELVGIDLDDVDFDNNSFVVTRKGGSRVILYFNDEIASTLKNYYLIRQTIEAVSPDENALFLSLQNKRLATRSVENIVKKYSQIATPLKEISPHKLRSTYGTELYRQTNDIYIVADVLGHKDVNTTKKHYAAISDDIRRKASQAVSLFDKMEENLENEK